MNQRPTEPLAPTAPIDELLGRPSPRSQRLAWLLCLACSCLAFAGVLVLAFSKP